MNNTTTNTLKRPLNPSPEEPCFKKQKKSNYQLACVFPDEIIHTIFLYAEKSTMSAMSSTCKRWNMISGELTAFFPALEIYDENTWKTHVNLSELGLVIENVNYKLSAFVALRQFYKKVNSSKAAALLVIPQGINLIKLNLIGSSPSNPNQFNISCPIEHAYLYSTLLTGCGSAQKTNWVVLSHDSFCFEQTNANLSIRKIGKGWGIAELLPALTLFALRQLTSKNQSDNNRVGCQKLENLRPNEAPSLLIQGHNAEIDISKNPQKLEVLAQIQLNETQKNLLP